MTLAPRRDTAVYSESRLRRGQSPDTICMIGGLLRMRSQRKQQTTTRMSPTVSSSPFRSPRDGTSSTSSRESRPERRMHWRSGRRKRRFRPTAVPITMVRSSATMLISHSTHRRTHTRRGYSWRHSSAKCFPVTRPSLAARVCSKMAIRLDKTTTHTRSYPKREPPSMAVAQFPGSRYATDTRNAGPMSRTASLQRWAMAGPCSQFGSGQRLVILGDVKGKWDGVTEGMVSCY
mmetsp:Transcript_24937/g.69549  ORF Transcript_24937/g.69549 Transcript_24937/m.69549 type:complete len:233 (+) Transcript_24937:2143-2841(+)